MKNWLAHQIKFHQKINLMNSKSSIYRMNKGKKQRMIHNTTTDED